MREQIKNIVANQNTQERDYWLNKMGGDFEKCFFLHDKKTTFLNRQIKSINFELNDSLSIKLLKICQNSDPKLHILLIASINVLLNKYTNSTDLTIGIPIHAQPNDDELINSVLAIRICIDEDFKFKDLLIKTHQATVEAIQNQNYPIESILYKLGTQSDEYSFPLFDIFILLNTIHKEKYISGYKTNFNFIFNRSDNNISLRVDYNVETYTEDYISGIISHYLFLLNNLLEQPDSKIKDIDILLPWEKENLLQKFTNTGKEISVKPIIRLIEDQVNETPERVAVCFKNDFLTYNQLNKDAYSFANELRKNGIKKGDIVPVLIDHSLELIVAFISVMKLGGVFAPLDVNWPIERIKKLTRDMNSDFILVNSSSSQLTKKNDITSILIELPQLDNCQEDFEVIINPEDPLYIIYTSGSTGLPKGVVVPNIGITNRFEWMNDYFGKNLDEVVLQTTRYVYDSVIWQFFWPLVNGGRTVIQDPDNDMSINNLSEIIVKHNISLMDFVPSIFNIIVDELNCNKVFLSRFKYLSNIIMGGEEISLSNVLKFSKMLPNIKITNLYGPTEASIGCIYHQVTANDIEKIPIGKPITNVKIFIVDTNNNIVPIGVSGEICIAGINLANGYLNDTTKTNLVFTNGINATNQIVYKTGDIGRWLTDGSIDFIGRKDKQVKIRGYRIELGEIENKLLSYSEIKNAVVTIKEVNNNKIICAYIVFDNVVTEMADSDDHFNSFTDFKSIISDIKARMANELPEYMMPSYIHPLKEIPLTPAGKINFNSLPLPKIEIKDSYVPPKNDIEKKLVSLWSEVLGVEKEIIGTKTDFFELGGHSLKATVLLSKIHKEFDAKIPLIEIFKRPTIIALSENLQQQKKQNYVPIRNIEKKEYYQLSSAQKRLFILQKIDPESIAYNIPHIYSIEGDFDYKKIEETFHRLINRHEFFRTIIQIVNDTPVQCILKESLFKIDYFDSNEEDKFKTFNEYIKHFDLSLDCYIKVGILKINSAKHYLIIDMHHIITDAVAHDLFISELLALYSGKNLPPLQFQYTDYAEWQNNETMHDNIIEQKNYWLNILKGEIPIINLPVDFERPRIQRFEGDTVGFDFNEQEVFALRRIAKQEKVTMFMLILAAFNILISKLSQQSDIIVGVPIAGRRHADLEKIIGVFVNTLAMRSKIKWDQTISEYLVQISENALLAFENQDYQFDKLLEELDIERSTGRNPLFDVVFLMLKNEDLDKKVTESNNSNLSISHFDNRSYTSKFDLTLSAVETEKQIYLNFEYSTRLFKRESVEKFISFFKRIVSIIANDTSMKLLDIEMISEEEKLYLLKELNQTKVGFPKNKTIVDLFVEQVKRTPYNIALKFENQVINYDELERRSTQLASMLRANGVIPDQVVGLLFDRSFEVVIGILAILKAGGAYLPMDVDYPEERISFMLEDSGAKIMLTSNKIRVNKKYNVDTLFVEEGYNYEVKDLENISKSSDLSYVIYTSGTTGKPKGVMVEHRNVVRLFFNDAFQFDFNSKDVWTMFHSHCFDFSVWEIFGALLFGGKLIIIPKIIAMDTMAFLDVLREEKVTIINQTPSAFYNLIRKEFSFSSIKMNLRYVIFGGEKLLPNKLKAWRKICPNVKLINMYGITETTVHVTYKEIGENEIENNTSNIGKPIPTLSVYILDENQKLVSSGVIGELYVGGAGVSRGYIGKKELTNERFVINPYNPTEILYRSGDLGRMISSGEIEYLGRVDNQVQLRGFRIELGEVECKLLMHEKIKDVLVVDKEVDENKCLVTYYVSENELDIVELKNFLLTMLPDYMIPSYFIKIDCIPLTTNGKVDKKRLPEPEFLLSSNYIKASNEIEEKIAVIWSEVLKVSNEKISMTDNFFSIGGHSLSAVIVVAKLHQCFNIKVPLIKLIETPTIIGLAKYIEAMQVESEKDLSLNEEREVIEI